MKQFEVEYKTQRQVKERAPNAFTWWPTGAKPSCDEAEAKQRFEFLVQCGIDGTDPEGHDDPPYYVRIVDTRKALVHDHAKPGAACDHVMLSQYAFAGDEPAGPWAKGSVN